MTGSNDGNDNDNNSNNSNQKKTMTKTAIVIVGSGLSGLLLAHYLLHSKHSLDVTIIERRPDPRVLETTAATTTVKHQDGDGRDDDNDTKNSNTTKKTRTFPIALNSRGMDSLRRIHGLVDAVERQGVYLEGICLHSNGGGSGGNNNNKTSEPVDKPKWIKREKPSLSIDRNRLALCLLEELVGSDPNIVQATSSTSSVSILFDTTLEDISNSNDDRKSSSTYITVRPTTDSGSDYTSKVVKFDHLVAADGARSQVRRYLADDGLVQCTVDDIPDEYKTIFLERTSTDGTLELNDKYLHGWMFPDVRIISAPVIAGCVSGAFVFDKGTDPFKNMKDADEVLQYFTDICPSSLGKEGIVSRQEADDLLHRPVSTTVSVRCNQLHAFLPSSKAGVLLIGDAGHAVSASVGQGANSALQDVEVFIDILERCKGDWAKALPAYTSERIVDAHAVSDLSDFSTPRTKWMKLEWVFRMILRKILPKWISYYVLRPLPMDLLMETSLPYREVLKQTSWWVERVKASLAKTVVKEA